MKVPFIGIIVVIALSISTRTSAQENPAFTPFRVDVTAQGSDVDELATAPIAWAPQQRGNLLLSLYATFGSFQVYDAATTLVGIRRGVSELNPVTRTLIGHPAVILVTKAALTTSAIYGADQLWRRHRRGPALTVMLVSNGIAAVVAAHNAAVLRRQP